MERTSSDSAREAAIEHEAAAWATRHDRGLTAAEQDEFFQWLNADPRHGEWLARHRKTVRGLRLLAQWRPEHGVRPNPDLLAQPARSASWRGPLFAGLAAGIALAAVLWRPGTQHEAVVPDSSRAHVESSARRQLLEDGSVIDLNRGAEVTVHFNTTERRVRLVRGEAHFTVQKNAARPFIVQADRIAVQAVGTAFDVRLAPHAVEVLVTEGRVQVNPSAPSPTAGAPIVNAGERAVVSLTRREATPAITRVSAAELARALAWQFRRLEFTDAPLAQVVAEFNRDNSVQIVIEDPALAGLRIGATLRSDNVEGLVRLLEQSFHVAVTRRGDSVIILHRASAADSR